MAKHDELVEAGFFDSKFKNTLRDYYTYGFKTYSDLQREGENGKQIPSTYTIDNDWKRLSNILHGYFEWKSKSDTAFFLSNDSQSLSENPFHKIYRFCLFNEKDPKFFFNIIFALSSKCKLADGVDSLDLHLQQIDDLPESFYNDVENNKPLSSSSLSCFLPDRKDVFKGRNESISYNLNGLVEKGLLKDNPEKMGKKIIHIWQLTGCYISSILEQGEKIDKGFVEHFSNALDFFSKYEVLGVVGSFILNRYNNKYKSDFRFKHEYYMQSVNDYSLIDLLTAIENKKWCEIDYKIDTNGIAKSIIVYPLEIRISSMNGREYLSFYEPFSRSYSNLRLEFIEDIKYIDGGVIKMPGKPEISLANEGVIADINNARSLLKHSWGASTTLKEDGNVKDKTPLYDVNIKIRINPEDKEYIIRRVKREQRIGTIVQHNDYIEFKAKVSDYRELRPWIRSFYSRILEYSCQNDLEFSVKEDLSKFDNAAVDKNVLNADINKSDIIWKIPKEPEYETEPSASHMLIFNEVFSVYYEVIADVLMQLYSSDEDEHGRFTAKRIHSIIESAIKKHKNKYGKKTQDILETIIFGIVRSNAFMREGADNNYGVWKKKSELSSNNNNSIEYMRKYCTNETSFYSSILPLSLIECRWLVTIINNPKIYLFLSCDEVEYLKDVLTVEQNIKGLQYSSIHYTDRFKTNMINNELEIRYINPLLDAICKHNKVGIQFTSARGDTIQDIYCPIHIEYSKRDNLFRCYAYAENFKAITIINIERIKQISIKDDIYDYGDVSSKLDAYIKRNMRSITIEFTDTKNIPDRILNEFAPWKKRCTYNKKTKIYQLKIFYQQQDTYELVVRLLGYGSLIRILNKDSALYNEYNKRLQKQREIENSKEIEYEH